MDAIARICAIEEIKVLKARYFRFLDAKQWVDLASVFTADATAIYPFVGTIEGSSVEIISQLELALENVTTVHQGAMPEIELKSEVAATGIWAMTDLLMWPPGARRTGPASDSYSQWSTTMRGYGHYLEEYKFVEERWLISKLSLTRLHVDLITHGASIPPVPPSPPQS
mgnify:CR=1 FL=1